MATENATLQLPKDLIEAVINQEIQKSIALALSDKQVFIQAVTSVLTSKVDGDGKYTNDSWRSRPYIEHAVDTAIKQAVKDVIATEIVSFKEQIKTLIAADLKRKNSPLLQNLVDVMTKGIVDASASSYRLEVVMYKENDK